MAFSYSSDSGLIAAGTATLTVPATTGAQGQIVGVHIKTGANTITTPVGHSPILSIKVGASKLALFLLTIGQDRAESTVTIQTRNAGGTLTGEGECFFLIGPFQFVSVNPETSATYKATTFTSPSITVSEDNSMVVSVVCPELYPRTHVIGTAGMTEIVDRYSANGPATAVAVGFFDSGDTAGPFSWTPTDAYNPSGAPGDSQIGATLLLNELTTSLDPVLSGGGTIPVAEISSIVWSGFSVFSAGATNTVTMTINGSDGTPFSNVPVVFSVSGQNTVSPTNFITNSSGEASPDLTTPLAGSGTIVAKVDGVQISSQTFTVAGSQVTIIAAPNQILEGQTFVVSGEASTTTGTPIANTAMSVQITGGTYEVVTAIPTQTTGSGTYAFQLQATSVGTLSIRVTVDTTQSPIASVLVSEIPNPDIEQTDLRLRLQTYTRTIPAKR